MLLGQALVAAGLQFTRATARHKAGGLLVVESIVVQSEDERARVLAWAATQLSLVLDPAKVTVDPAPVEDVW